MEVDPLMAKEILEQIDSLAVCDSEGRYIYVSRYWEEWFSGGLRAEDVIGKYVRDVIANSKFDMCLQTKQPVVGEILLLPKDETNIVKRTITNYYPIFKEGKLIAAVGFAIFRDMDVALNFQERLIRIDEEVKLLKSELRESQEFSISYNIFGNSMPMRKMKQQIFQAARSNSTVLITGETGTGKELIANAIHNASQRKARSFIKINCAAIPGDLLEAELFGYEGGSFTGALKSGRHGKFEMANMGSLFLDEINQLPMSLQPKLLRVLQEREVDRIGGGKSLKVDVRVIASTNVALDKLVEQQKFRSDLFYRLNVMLIKVPPLRERKEDLPLLIKESILRLNRQLGIYVEGVSPEVLKILLAEDWPGNVRELQNVLEQAMNIAWNGTLELKHFEWFIENRQKEAATIAAGSHRNDTLKEIKNSVEKEALDEALRSCGNNKTRAAKKLHITRAMIYRKMRKFGIDPI